MDWMDGVRRLIRMNEEQITLIESMIPGAPNDEARHMLRRMITRRREQIRTFREMVGSATEPMGPMF
jgi:ribosomal protein L22